MHETIVTTGGYGAGADRRDDAARGAARRAAIAAYYDYTTPLYRVFWHGRTGAVHYGFRDATTETLRDELLNTNRFLAGLAHVGPSTQVLDAGCGVGGSAVWIARTTGAHVVGITLSETQATRARAFARRHQVDRRAEFHVRDYLHTGFAAESFDVVWALESACYAPDKRLLLREAHRVLRPGGRIVVGDGFLKRRPESAREERAYAHFRAGLVLPEVATADEFAAAMRDAGFSGVRYWEKTAAATPSGRRLWARCLCAYPVARLGEALGLTPRLLTDNVRAGISQYGMIRSGLIGYGVLYAERAG